ncbi:unnamed protein product [Urochloa humidicola]
MEPGCTNLTNAVRLVHQLKINGYSAAASIGCMKTKWIVDGYEWEIKFDRAYGRVQWHGHGRSRHSIGTTWWVALTLILLSKPRHSDVMASLSCRLLDPSGDHGPSEETVNSKVFYHPQDELSDPVCLIKTEDLRASGYLKDDSLTIECTITVVQELPDAVIADNKKQNEPLPVPSSDMHQHFGELLKSQKGADVTFNVSGEFFSAHKLVLAARSPVFMAEFFGGMEERSSKSVEIEDMEAAVFKAMLHFIYTDMVPELDGEEQEPNAAAVMAQHLLAAADRYGLQRLKVICEGKLSSGISVDTAAATLALAEQHNCSLLRATCVEFITASPETLDAVVETEGYKHLVASCPLVFTELLKAAHGRKK